MVSEEKKLFKSLQERLDEQRIKRQQEQLADRDEIIRYEADADTGLTAQQVKEHFESCEEGACSRPSGNDHEHEEEQEVPEGAACRTGIHRYYRVLQRFC